MSNSIVSHLQLTISLQQMKVIHEIGFTDEETEGYRRQVFLNLWEAMRLCLEGMQELGLKLADPDNRVSLSADNVAV